MSSIPRRGGHRSYECNRCNNHVSIYPDDDGGYLRIFVGLYMRRPLALS